MLGGNCTEALSNQATVTFSGSIAKLIENGIAPLPFPLPALLKQSWYIKRGERVRVRGHAPFYVTLGGILPLHSYRLTSTGPPRQTSRRRRSPVPSRAETSGWSARTAQYR